MPKHYTISMQFADPNAPDFNDEIMPVIDDAIRNYNIKSRIAKNPKKITKKKVVDPRTLQLTLESDIELPFPGKGLHLLSAYLVNPKTNGSLKDYIYGKQLFKMSSEEITVDSRPKQELNVSEGLNTMRIKAISHILLASEDTLRKVINIFEEV